MSARRRSRPRAAPGRSVRHRGRVALCAAIAVALLTGCAPYQPRPLAEVPFQDRIESAERNGLRVSVSVLSREEARETFGVDLYAKGIQPVWVSIENRTEKHWAFMQHGLDPNYYSAREAAYKSHAFLSPGRNRAIDRRFD